MLVWNWKVRIYNSNEMYGCAQIPTERDMEQIKTIQEFYEMMTGHRLVIEGMAEEAYPSVPLLHSVFNTLWKAK